MTLNQFQKKCVAAETPYLTRGDEALISLMGMNGAAGKCIDIYKKALYDGQELDREQFIEQLSYMAIYLAMAANSIDCKLDDVFGKVFATDTGDKKT